jgi:hypothetical protein
MQEVEEIMENIANEPAPARLILSAAGEMKEKPQQKVEENMYTDEEGMSGSIGVGLKTYEGR